ncbi:MFS transporter [Pseudarthrobacter sp. fls2-241-R2A-127]|uniref:MFS transporter n=1 Tax=Pseudarthrobacter sp. fls2-241-R2A-127 TaxID=3040303 RepID=UPI002553B732|nr:MFS transporter [Pseudarthrobacter sp. fls2-241-R2A-127]
MSNSQKVLTRPFAQLLSAMFVLHLGTAITTVALPVFIVQRYGFSGDLAFSLALRLLPMVFAGGVAAWVLGRVDARWLAALSATATGIATALIPLTSNLVELNVLSVISGFAGVLGSPAMMMLRSGVLQQDNVMKGNGLIVVAERAPLVIGPAIAAPVLLISDVSTLLIAEALATLLSGLLIVGLPAVPREDKPAEPKSLISRVRESALDYRTQGYAVTGIFYTIAVSAGRIVMIALATFVFGDNPAALAWLLSAMALGAVAGGMIGGQFPKRWIGPIYLIGNLVEGGLWIGIGVSDWLPATIGLLVLAGLFESVATTAFFADLQLRLSPAGVGRFFAFFLPIVNAAAVLGTLVGSWLVPDGNVLFGCVAVAILIIVPFVPYLKVYTVRKGDVSDETAKSSSENVKPARVE